MNETSEDPSSTGQESGLVDETGSRISSGRTPSDLEPIVCFSREQPLATVLIGLVIGFVLGRTL
jgi:hypothetical protein